LTSFIRLLGIFRILLKYRLDTLLKEFTLPLVPRILCKILGLLPEPKKPRGIRLRQACEDLGPIFIKFGQLLSTRPDIVPSDIASELTQLQDNVPAFSNKEFVDIVERELGQSVSELFASFEENPLASASVAQVHAAIMHNGDEVVVKVIRPGIEKTIYKDLSLMHWLARAIEASSADGKRLRAIEVIEDYRQTILNELDLKREASNASQLRRNFSQSPLLYVPEIVWPMVRKNVMVMERIHGIPVTNIDALHDKNTNMKLLAERGVEIFFTQVFEHNFFHADMHPGNIFVDINNPDAPSYIAVDMAIVSSLNQDDQYYVARNLLAMFRRDYRMIAELHVFSGWVNKDTNVNEFEAAIRTVCEPIFEKPLKEISFAQVLITLFQTAQQFDMTVQPQLVLLQKTLLNIEGLGRQLYPDLDLWTTAHPFMEKWLKNRFHPKTLLKQLKRYGPEWMEKFPQIPNLIFQSLQQVGQFEEQAEKLRKSMETEQKKQRQSQRRHWIAVAALLSAGLLAWPQLVASASQSLGALPTTSLVLLAIGALALLFR